MNLETRSLKRGEHMKTPLAGFSLRMTAAIIISSLLPSPLIAGPLLESGRKAVEASVFQSAANAQPKSGRSLIRGGMALIGIGALTSLLGFTMLKSEGETFRICEDLNEDF